MELLNLKDDSHVTKASKLSVKMKCHLGNYSLPPPIISPPETPSYGKMGLSHLLSPQHDETQLFCVEDLNLKDMNKVVK